MENLYGLLGQSLVHSISPKIHEAIFYKTGLNAHYQLFEIEECRLQEALNTFKEMNVAGINVTVPYKISIIKYLDRLSKEAMAIGAVNCITFCDNITVGYNTDYFGFGMLLKRHHIKVKNKRALVLGYGGAAKTVISFLLDHGVESIIIAVRDITANLLDNMHIESGRITLVNYEALASQMAGDIIINCTPCGMYPNVNRTPVNFSVLESYNTAVDLIYNPTQTLFLKQASEAGLKTVNGLYMLVSQAVAAQEIWNNIILSPNEIEDIYTTVSEYLLQEKK